MDVSFTCQSDGLWKRQVSEKSTHTNRYTLFSSYHPVKVRADINQVLADRAIKVCSDEEMLDRELKRILSAMEGNGYPKQFTEKAISR